MARTRRGWRSILSRARDERGEPHGSDLAELRTTLGTSTALRAENGEVVLEPGWWQALTGARSVDLNVVACDGGDVAAGVARGLEVVASARVPAVIMLAGPALDTAQLLVAAGWVCIGATPSMVSVDGGGVDDPCVHTLGQSSWPRLAAWSHGRSSFRPIFRWWQHPTAPVPKRRRGMGSLRGRDKGQLCQTGSVDGSLAVWSMAPPQRLRRRGTVRACSRRSLLARLSMMSRAPC